jgi:hypothetical protein
LVVLGGGFEELGELAHQVFAGVFDGFEVGLRGEEGGFGLGFWGEVVTEEDFAEAGHDEAVESAGVFEADFDLGGVDVDVDVFGGQREEEDGGGLSAGLGEAAVGFLEGVGEGFVLDGPAVDVEVLVLGGGVGEFGEADDTGEVDLGVAELDGEVLLAEGVGPGFEEAEFGGGGGKAEGGTGVVGEGEVDVWVREGELEDHLGDMAELGGGAFHELSAGGGVEEEVADLDGGAGVAGSGLHQGVLAAAGFNFVGGGVGRAGAGEDAEVGDGGDGGDGLAAEALGGDAEEVVIVDEFGGGMLGEREGELFGGDAATVVDDSDKGEAAVLDVDEDGA